MGLGCLESKWGQMSSLTKVSKVVSNGPPGNYCKVPNEHVIGHVLVGQNRGSTNMPLFGKDSRM